MCFVLCRSGSGSGSKLQDFSEIFKKNVAEISLQPRTKIRAIVQEIQDDGNKQKLDFSEINGNLGGSGSKKGGSVRSGSLENLFCAVPPRLHAEQLRCLLFLWARAPELFLPPVYFISESEIFFKYPQIVLNYFYLSRSKSSKSGIQISPSVQRCSAMRQVPSQ